MLPHSFLGILISILAIVGAGFILDFLAKKTLKLENGQNAISYYAFLVILASIHPLGTLLAALIACWFIFRGNSSQRAAVIVFMVVLVAVLILGFIFSHAFIIFPLWRI